MVTHNGAPWISECLESIAQQVYPGLDSIVVDSGSRVRAEATVTEVLPEAEYLRMEANLGFGAAANRALEVSAKASGAEYFLFLHDDVAMDPECVGRLVDAALETGAGVVGGKGVDWNDPEILVEVGMAADQFCYPFSGLETGEIDQGQHDRRREALFVTSACMLVSREMEERCGSWDGAYFAFGEDLDLCLRGQLAGFRVVVSPGARFRHAAAMASQARDSEAARRIRFYTRRNRLRTIAKTTAAYRVWAVLFLNALLVLGEVVLLAGLRRFEEIPAY
ncbi:MAG: glycosyltransferase family 2 protein, partial [Acidimicrobiales bacterium]